MIFDPEEFDRQENERWKRMLERMQLANKWGEWGRTLGYCGRRGGVKHSPQDEPSD